MQRERARERTRTCHTYVNNIDVCVHSAQATCKKCNNKQSQLFVCMCASSFSTERESKRENEFSTERESKRENEFSTERESKRENENMSHI